MPDDAQPAADAVLDPQTVPALVRGDEWLAPYAAQIIQRQERLAARLRVVEASAGSLADFANAHLYFGLHETAAGHVFREWAPAAHALFLTGDFNDWNRRSHPLRRLAGGAWEIHLDTAQRLAPPGRFKVHVVAANGAQDRIPLFARYVVQDPASLDYAAAYTLPPQAFAWTDQSFRADAAAPLLIYEAHPGMAQERAGVGTYNEFAATILPRIVAAGYNTVQLMAVMEHPYYASFGYHVTNFFAPSSRFGTPEELKGLINTAHGLGLRVLLDVVHSHAAKNTLEGLAQFDGTREQFFHAGPRGEHPLWDSLLFDYGQGGVQHFLLSNLKYWLDDFHFDGFRFDGVTSMMYRHHGVGTSFGHYDDYFGAGVDDDGVTYLQLANHLIHTHRPQAITVAEDVSGMPGIAAPLADGGLGFDYRLAMGLPDFWVQTVKDVRDESWSMHGLFHALTNRRAGERCIAYVESHDQCLVGDQTLLFRLIGPAVYDHMQRDDPDPIAARGLALHKLSRLVTLAAGGDGYLNFMGNEFGHPEWVDFPRAGNDWSYAYARRQWSLGDNPALKYQYLGAFDRALLAAVGPLLRLPTVTLLRADDTQLLLVFQRGGHIVACNFHPLASQPDVHVVGVPTGRYRAVLNSDDRAFGGHGLVDPSAVHDATGGTLAVYLPARTAIVYTRLPDGG